MIIKDKKIEKKKFFLIEEKIFGKNRSKMYHFVVFLAVVPFCRF